MGPGIYGGNVQRHSGTGEVVIGQQYQNHNPVPGPVYAGTGYSLMSRAVHAGPEAVARVLADHPALATETTTGGATPLHVCGMSRTGQRSVGPLVAAGADVEARDTYGFTPLHRMASNNLADGARALLEAGADPMPAAAGRGGGGGATPLAIAAESRARETMEVLKKHGAVR